MPVSTHGALLGGRYRVLRPLGLGGMAQVLLCRDEHLGRLVAVKRLHADSPEDVERRFAREARLGAALNHPNLVSVFDTAVDDDGVLIVMEYVEGEALSRALRRGPLGPARVASMARDLGAALDHAHAHNVVHRDVKPGNVLLRNDGITKLADLGIATAVDLTRITRSGELLGTAAYMAPEQLEGGEARPGSDVYALAAVCFEALAGVRPRRGRTAVELAHRIATEPAPDLRDQVPSAPPAAAEALIRGMARDPDERTPTAGELAAELAAALEGREPPPPPAAALPTRRLPRPEPVAGPLPAGRARPQTANALPPLPAPRRRRRFAALIPVALLALAAAAVAAVLVSGGGGSAGEPDGASQQARDGRSGGQTQQSPGQADGTAKDKKDKDKKDKKDKKAEGPASSDESVPSEQPPAPAPPQAATPVDPARGAQLNEQGFALMQRGDYAAAVAILEQAVASWPDGSTEMNYAYALFNLGKSLNRSGRSAEAIPYLERRLQWEDQRATVQAELELARRNAGQG